MVAPREIPGLFAGRRLGTQHAFSCIMLDASVRRTQRLCRFLALVVAPALAAPSAGCSSSPLGGADGGAGGGMDGSSPPGEICGGLAGITCSAGSYCQFPVSSRCGAADAT